MPMRHFQRGDKRTLLDLCPNLRLTLSKDLRFFSPAALVSGYIRTPRLL